MDDDRDRWAEELEELLDALSYELTAVRTTGVGRPDETQQVVRRIGRMVSDLEALVNTIQATRRTTDEA